MKRTYSVLSLVALALTALLVVAPGFARKVANPGSLQIQSETGTFRINSETFTFDPDDPRITFTGTIGGQGNYLVPPSGVSFPPQFTTVDGGALGTYTFRISLSALTNTTGNIDPLSGASTLITSLRIDIDPEGSGPPGFGSDCRITPVNLSLSSAHPQGVPYNSANGRGTVGQDGFHAPGAQGCGSAFFGAVNYNDEINNALGLPTSNTSAVISAITTPILQKAIVPSFTATPTSGHAPLSVDFNASASTAVAGISQYRWDFDNNGTTDATGVTANHTYTTAGTKTAKLTVVDSENDSASTTKTVTVTTSQHDLAIDKSHTGDFTAGSPAQYTIAVRNVGPDPTQGTITVTDAVPASLANPSASGTGWNCSTNGQVVTCTHPGPVAGGASMDPITLTADATGDAIPSVANTATVATPGDVGAGNNSDTDTANVFSPNPDLTIDKTHEGGAEALRGQNLVYRLAVSNAGNQPAVGEITVTDTLPAGVTYVSSFGDGWNCSFAAPTVTCTTDTDVPGLSAANVIRITTTVDGSAPNSLTNSATVAVASDTNANNNSDSDTVSVRDPGVDLSVDKSHSGTFDAGAGDETYQLVVKNNGTDPASGVKVTDTLPAELSYVSASGSGWVCGAAGQVVTCDRAVSLEPGQTAPAITLRVAVSSTASGTVINTADVSGSQGDLNPADNHDEDPTQIRQLQPDLQIDKSHAGNVTAGQTASWSIKVKNVGVDPTMGPITVTDTIPAATTFVSAAGTGWSCGFASGTVTCTRSTVLSAGASAAEIVLRVTPKREAVPSVSNTATVSSTGDQNSANDSDTDSATVNLPPSSTATVTRIVGSGKIPGALHGDATISIDVTRGSLGVYNGWITVQDPSANMLIYQAKVVGNSVSRYGVNGAKGQALLNDGRTRFSWQVDDLSAVNLGPDDIFVQAPGYVNGGTTTFGGYEVLPRG